MDQNDSFANRLERLFQERRKSDGSGYTQADVVAGTGGIITRVYLWKLRTGRATNPSFQIVQALTGFFGVESGYFFLQESPPESLPDPLLELICARARQLDEVGRRAVLKLLDYLVEVGEG